MWEVRYGLEAANYLNDNGTLVADLFFAIEALAEVAGWLKEGEYQLIDELISWQILRHQVIYQRLEHVQAIQVAAIKPN
jgi:hypothetical protein